MKKAARRAETSCRKQRNQRFQHPAGGNCRRAHGKQTWAATGLKSLILALSNDEFRKFHASTSAAKTLYRQAPFSQKKIDQGRFCKSCDQTTMAPPGF